MTNKAQPDACQGTGIALKEEKRKIERARADAVTEQKCKEQEAKAYEALEQELNALIGELETIVTAYETDRDELAKRYDKLRGYLDCEKKCLEPMVTPLLAAIEQIRRAEEDKIARLQVDIGGLEGMPDGAVEVAEAAFDVASQKEAAVAKQLDELRKHSDTLKSRLGALESLREEVETVKAASAAEAYYLITTKFAAGLDNAKVRSAEELCADIKKKWDELLALRKEKAKTQGDFDRKKSDLATKKKEQQDVEQEKETVIRSKIRQLQAGAGKAQAGP